jgi:tetratricopeptide (TPR) repeat protein
VDKNVQNKPEIANDLNNLGNLYFEKQSYTESESMYKDSLAIRKRLAKLNPLLYEPEVASSLSKLGELYFKMMRYDDSVSMYKESLKIYRRQSMPNLRKYIPYIALNKFMIRFIKNKKLDK